MTSLLLILVPLRIEQAAVGRPSGAQVLRTGMGPERARIAAARALGHDAPVLAVAGVCAAIDPRLRAGDVVCATELRRERAEPVALPDSATLLAILRGRGLQVKAGALFSTDRIMSPGERRSLTGEALGVDMESAWLAAGAAARPFAVVRVVADAADRRLADPRLAYAGARALFSLRRVGGALAEWGAEIALQPVSATPSRPLGEVEEAAVGIVEFAHFQRGAGIT